MVGFFCPLSGSDNCLGPDSWSAPHLNSSTEREGIKLALPGTESCSAQELAWTWPRHCTSKSAVVAPLWVEVPTQWTYRGLRVRLSRGSWNCYPCPGGLQLGVLQCLVNKGAFEDFREASVRANCSSWIPAASQKAHLSPAQKQLCQLFWVQGQLQVFIPAYQALGGLGPGCLGEHKLSHGSASEGANLTDCPAPG